MKYALHILATFCWLLSARGTQAEIDAVTFPPSAVVNAVGYTPIGVGWSFVPQTDLIVTSVGYAQLFAFDETGILRIILWSPEKAPMKVYTAGETGPVEERDTNQLTFAKIPPILLRAGMQYFITSDLGTNPEPVEVFSPDLTQKQMPYCAFAPDLEFRGVYDYDSSRSTLTSSAAGDRGLILGPTFRYELAPRLVVTPLENAVLLTWPASTLTFSVETATSIWAADWKPVSPLVIRSLSGDQYSLRYEPADDPVRFFRLNVP